MKFKLDFPEAITRWDEGIPLGNGKTGCLIWGQPANLRFHLDRTDIWDCSGNELVNTEEFTYQNMVRLAKEKNTAEIRRIFDEPYNHPLPTKLPLGAIVLHFPTGTTMRGELDMGCAQAVLSLEYEAAQTVSHMSISALCHAKYGTGMIRILADPNLFSIELEHPVFQELPYPDAVCEEKRISEEIRLLRYLQSVSEELTYGIVAVIRQMAKETQIFYQVLSSKDGDCFLESQEALLTEQIIRGYETCLPEHCEWWNRYWEQSNLSLPNKMAEKQWYVTNYLFASCSRKGCYPMPLQGVWTADDGCLPPWKGDYHNDLNTQLSYTHFLKAGHLEEGESFLDFLWELRPQAKAFAQRFYGTDGICLPGVMTIDGEALGGWPMYSLSPTQQIWLCQSFDLYYRYTGDREFLKTKAWVYFKETALCITQLLEEGEDGMYVLPVSSSPEIHDDEAGSWLTPNSNYDLSLMRYLYQSLVEYAKLLDYPEEAARWGDILKKLPELAVAEDGVLLLSPDERLQESHRHLSNAMAICPLRMIGYETEAEKRIVDATVLDYERLGSGMWVGFSFPWMSHLYSVQGNGEGAWEQLRIFWESFCSPNGFHLNGDYKKRGYTTFHYRPFTLEANMYAADALQEMLLKTEPGRITLFPAIPDEWKKQEVAFEGLRAFDGVSVSAKMKEEKLVSLTLKTDRTQKIFVEGAWGKEKQSIEIKAGESWHWELKSK